MWGVQVIGAAISDFVKVLRGIGAFVFCLREAKHTPEEGAVETLVTDDGTLSDKRISRPARLARPDPTDQIARHCLVKGPGAHPAMHTAGEVDMDVSLHSLVRCASRC